MPNDQTGAHGGESGRLQALLDTTFRGLDVVYGGQSYELRLLRTTTSGNLWAGIEAVRAGEETRVKVGLNGANLLSHANTVDFATPGGFLEAVYAELYTKETHTIGVPAGLRAGMKTLDLILGGETVSVSFAPWTVKRDDGVTLENYIIKTIAQDGEEDETVVLTPNNKNYFTGMRDELITDVEMYSFGPDSASLSDGGKIIMTAIKSYLDGIRDGRTSSAPAPLPVVAPQTTAQGAPAAAPMGHAQPFYQPPAQHVIPVGQLPQGQPTIVPGSKRRAPYLNRLAK